jgi:hypothetical protein
VTIDLRRWLRRQPQPAKLRVDGRDVAIPTERSPWAALEATVLAMEASKVEAFAADGTVIRVVRLDGDDDDVEPADEVTAVGSPQMLDVVAMSKLLAEAHKEGYAALNRANEENTRLVGLVLERLSGVEHAYAATLKQLAEAQASEAGGGGGMGEIVSALVQGQAMANGAGKT